MGNAAKKPSARKLAAGQPQLQPAQVTCPGGEGPGGLGAWRTPLWIPGGVDVASAKFIIETAKGIPSAKQNLIIAAKGGKTGPPLRDNVEIPPGAVLEVSATCYPIDELEHRLSRQDSSGIVLARRIDRPPWDGEYEKHVLRTDEVPGLLGHGGYAKVYRCRRRGAPPNTTELFAIKQILKRRICSSFSQVRQCLVEFCCAQMLPLHPNVIHVREVLHDKQVVYAVMDLTRGKELYDLIQDSKIQQQMAQQPTIAHMMRQLLSALNHLHARGIAHRDVKPENCICDPDNNFHVVLIDLGLARFCGDPASQMTPGGLAGLPKASAMQEVDFGDVDDGPAAGPAAGAGMSDAAYKAMLDVMPTPGAMTTAYASAEAIRAALMQEERHRLELPAMDIYGAGATCFACLVRMVPFIRQSEMASLPAAEWMGRMVARSRQGIERERGWDNIKKLLDADGQAFLVRLMHADVAQRYTAQQALGDKWLDRWAPDKKSSMPAQTPFPDALRTAANPASPESPQRGGYQGSPRQGTEPMDDAFRRPAEDFDVEGGEDLEAAERAAALTLLSRRKWKGQ
eukprot:TRINITY_DN135_c0_g1_i1.p1 TRINITY_DN135_c0_g1~~TRINITY_DN135_c0_g1_i1.p1  ORF type:complete len:599 (+),score=179.93 TRINITY_DN135_c0_g1_i1:92-1798(+)